MRVKLKSFEAVEKVGKTLETKINRFPIDDFNLLISDNAQGKSRLLRMLSFFSQLFRDKPKIIKSNFSGELAFEVRYSQNVEEVKYEIDIVPSNGENIFHESVTRNGKPVYSSEKKLLFNETAQCEVKNYFIPKNLPALSSINESDFTTINLLRNFFQRIVLVDSNKSREIKVSPDSIVPDAGGANISSVLNNWKKSYPEIFNEVVNEFMECFPLIHKIYFTKQDIQDVMQADVLTLDEDNVDKPILQTQWSDGLIRILYLLMAPKIPFNINGERLPPSLVLVDEIENGLDFNRLKYIINYLRDHSDDSQVMISSHSPLVCDFVHPGNWIVVKRKGPELNFMSPKLKEKELDDQLDLFKHKHWDFYTKHISNSEIYHV